MESKLLNTARSLPFLIVPIVSIFSCLVFNVAQGEKSEELVIGIFLGIILDFIYAMFLLALKKATSKTITSVIFAMIAALIIWLVFSVPFGSIGEHTYQSAKDYSVSFLKHNREELERIAKETLKNKNSSVNEYKKASEIKYDEPELAVNFEMGSQGMLGGQYWRLVYTEKGNYRGETDKYNYY